MIKRKLLDELKNHLFHPEISLIVGPRQSGKTYLIRLLQSHLEASNQKTLYLNMDIEADRPYFSSQESLLQKIRLTLGHQGFVFLDEIQRKENAGLFLKGLYDMNLPYKLVVSGSGSFELKEKIHESLAGRKRVFFLHTLSFPEFVDFKTDYKYSDRLSDYFTLEATTALTLLQEYLRFGGYPQVTLAPTIEEKLAAANEILSSYLEKDLTLLLNLKKAAVFSRLFQLLASQIGQPVRYIELSSTLGLSYHTLIQYLWYLQKTFSLHSLTPYFKNARKELTKSPVFYFEDLGLANLASGTFHHPPLPENLGFLFQNFVFRALLELTQNSPIRTHFWRTKDGAEMDFIVDLGREIIPIEVKYQSLAQPEISRSFRNFLSKYHPPRAYIINLALKSQTKLVNTTVHTLPFFELFSPNLLN